MKRHAPATARNSDAIGTVLDRELPEQGCVFEVASGSGEHAVFFARRFPHLLWQPSDMDTEGLASIAAWREEAGLKNILAPVHFATTEDECAVSHAQAVFCANMVHISPWSASCGLFEHAARLLPTGAPLILYGPYLEADVQTAPSNLDFDRSLRSRNAAWGLRHLAQMDDLASDTGFTRTARYPMPANNLTLVYRCD